MQMALAGQQTTYLNISTLGAHITEKIQKYNLHINKRKPEQYCIKEMEKNIGENEEYPGISGAQQKTSKEENNCQMQHTVSSNIY